MTFRFSRDEVGQSVAVRPSLHRPRQPDSDVRVPKSISEICPPFGALRTIFLMLTVPNLFSIARIVLILPLVVLLNRQRYDAAFIVFVIAAVTDALDGATARLLGQRSAVGAYLDPAADKLLMTASFITLGVLHLIPSWLMFLVILRDVIIVAGLAVLRLNSRRPKIRPSIASKLTTIFQLLTIGVALLYPSGLPPLKLGIVAAAAMATVISGLQYIWKGIKILRYGESAEGG